MKLKSEDGVYTIEAILSLTLFMFAFVVLISFATVARVESTVQYAVNQSAKEVAQYCYIASKVTNLNTYDSDGNAQIAEVDDAVQSVMDFSDIMSDTISESTESLHSDSIDSLLDVYESTANNVGDIKQAAAAMQSSLGAVGDDAGSIVKVLAKSMLRSGAKAIISKIIAQPLCKIIMPKYISAGNDADAMLEKMGVINGIDGMDFSMSSFLADDKTINIVCVYQIKVNGFGTFDRTLNMKQTASTAAWVANGPMLADIGLTPTMNWGESATIRGKHYVELIKNEAGENSVESGSGIDIYSQSTNTFTEVYSINPFSASYSDYNASGDGSADCYSFKSSVIKSKLKSYANKVKKDVSKVDVELKMSDGRTVQTAKESVRERNKEIIIVVPDEAADSNSNKKKLNDIANEIEEETGVKVTITYRDKALGE